MATTVSVRSLQDFHHRLQKKLNLQLGAAELEAELLSQVKSRILTPG